MTICYVCAALPSYDDFLSMRKRKGEERASHFKSKASKQVTTDNVHMGVKVYLIDFKIFI